MIRFQRLSRHWLFGGWIVLYAIVLFSQAGHGLGSLDGNGIIRATRVLAQEHRIEVSRPPGHPTTEFYLYGALAWVMKEAANRDFDATTYLIIQAVSAILALCIFYELLLHIGTPPGVAALAALCLGISPSYLANAVDGEEFIIALLFTLLAVRLLLASGSDPVTRARLMVSVLCFALATGCRPEAIFAGVIYPLYSWKWRLGWRQSLLIFAALGAAMFLVWLPILLHGVQSPYQSGMNWRQAVLMGGYKICFQSFGPFVFAALVVLIAHSLLRIGRFNQQPMPMGFLHLASCILSVLFLLVFFRYATKPAYVLVALPFLLILGIDWSPRFIFILALLSVLETMLSIDIFRDRQLTLPFLAAGAWERSIEQKPYEKGRYLHELSSECTGAPTLIIANAWGNDFDYQAAHGWSDLRKQTLAVEGNEQIVGFRPPDAGDCLLVPRDVAFRTTLLEQMRSRGYNVKMEARLYRALFEKFEVTRSDSVAAREGANGFTLFALRHDAKPVPAIP